MRGLERKFRGFNEEVGGLDQDVLGSHGTAKKKQHRVCMSSKGELLNKIPIVQEYIGSKSILRFDVERRTITWQAISILKSQDLKVDRNPSFSMCNNVPLKSRERIDRLDGIEMSGAGRSAVVI